MYIFEEMMAENSPNLIKDINLQIQEGPNRINSKKCMLTRIIVNLQNTENKK